MRLLDAEGQTPVVVQETDGDGLGLSELSVHNEQSPTFAIRRWIISADSARL